MLPVAYRFQAVSVNFIGTHAEYELIDAETAELAGWNGHPPDSRRCRA